MEVSRANVKPERGRFSSRKKVAAVLQMLRGEDLDGRQRGHLLHLEEEVRLSGCERTPAVAASGRDNWSRSSPVLEAGFRISGDIVVRVLDRVLGTGQVHAPSRLTMAQHSNPEPSRIEPNSSASSLTLSDQDNPSQMHSLNHLMGSCGMNV